MAIPEHPEPFSLGNHIRIIAFTPDLQRVFFHGVTDILCYSSTTKRIPSLTRVRDSYPSSKATPLYRKSLSVLWLLLHGDLCKIAMRVGTSDRSEWRSYWAPHVLRKGVSTYHEHRLAPYNNSAISSLI
jgi:hypothetical protein